MKPSPTSSARSVGRSLPAWLCLLALLLGACGRTAQPPTPPCVGLPVIGPEGQPDSCWT
ncbi:hypothetical protein [Deinococcus pimensis]|uniref:hypothetical protein n=1 Tax=Deinococcus pimensis TaxID=309888 RepID=UPI0004B06BC9|nr:hypothetical protein [Deinococcus pimensis]